MLADAVAWVCRTPRRLALFAVIVMAVILIGAHVLGADGTSVAGDGKQNGAQPIATAAQVPDAGQFVATAVKFVQTWNQVPAGTSVSQWQQDLAPLTTAELAKALTTTDPASLPDSAPQGEPVVRYVANTSALIAVPLADGSSVLVTVVSDGDGSSRVSDVQPFAGDN